ncbi:MAG: hypothetical protein ABFC63_06035 [Thermoguttaceae bacterium]
MKRVIYFGLLAGAFMTTTGCGVFPGIFCYRPCMMRGDCGGCGSDECNTCGGPRYGVARRAAVCGDCGGDSCGAVCRTRYRSCGTCDSCSSFGDCGDSCTDPCGDSCYGRPWHRGPLSCLFALFTPCGWYGGCGCGERYWGDFYSDPPDCWDPCDSHGNYTGGGSSMTSSGTVSSGNGGGCRHCNGGGNGNAHYSNNQYSDGQSTGRMSSSDEQVISDRIVNPTSAQPHKAAKPYRQQQ